VFRSAEEEREWVSERRRKRLNRPSKFDAPPTAQQLATDAAALALSNPAATDFAGIPADRNFSAVPQQTRHARRLYIGHLPPNVTEQELHVFFRAAIQQALVEKTGDEDPILSVYINHERRFCFLEFKTVEMATACLALDGIDIHGKGKVKVKRPNDYNPSMAPKVHPSAIPQLDVSKLGIISGTVQDGSNKVFVGGK
jgi:splicing factor U2AF subunit